ncbi:YjbF family lipoprotein [Veronia pacifica]
MMSAGCSQTTSLLGRTVSDAWDNSNDVFVSQADVDALPYASMYAKVGDGARAFVVLAFADKITHRTQNGLVSKTELSWLSADKKMLVTESGRLTRTHGLREGELLNVNTASKDPISDGLLLKTTPNHWTRYLDWQPGNHFAVRVDSTFENRGSTLISVNDKPVNTIHIVEHVRVKSLDLQYSNDFWLSPDSGDVLASRQHLAPGLPEIKMTILKPFG